MATRVLAVVRQVVSTAARARLLPRTTTTPAGGRAFAWLRNLWRARHHVRLRGLQQLPHVLQRQPQQQQQQQFVQQQPDWPQQQWQQPIRGERLIPLSALTLGLGLGSSSSSDHWPQIDAELPQVHGLADLQLGKLLCSGSSCTIIEARANNSTLSLVAKRHANLVDDVEEQEDELANRFGREHRLLLKLSHPGVTRVAGGFVAKYVEVDGDRSLAPSFMPRSLHGDAGELTFYTVMPQFTCSLRQLLADADGGLGSDQILLGVSQLADADAYLKQRGIAHRDVRSANVGVCWSSTGALRFVLIDFGEAVEGLRLELVDDTVQRWGNNDLVPPEVARAQPGPGVALCYNSADLWAICSLAYEAALGYNPLSSALFDTRCQYNASQCMPSLREKLGVAADFVLRRGVSQSPCDRPSSSFVADCLQRCLSPATVQLQQLCQRLLARAQAISLTAPCWQLPRDAAAAAPMPVFCTAA